MAKQYNPGISGLFTEPNPADSPSNTLTDAENIIIEQNGKVKARHGFNIKSTESPTNFVAGEALTTNTTFIPSIPNSDVQVTDSLSSYVHYSSFFNGNSTFLKLFEFKNSSDQVLSGMLVKQNKNQFVTTDDGTNVTYLFNTSSSNPIYRYYKIDADSGKLVSFDEISYSEVKNIFTTNLSTYLQTEDGIAEANNDDLFRPTANRFFTVKWPSFPKISHELNRSSLYGNWLYSYHRIGVRITFFREMGYNDKIEEVYESQPSPVYEIVNNGKDAIPSIYFDFQTIVDATNLYKLWNDFSKLNNGRKFGIKVYRTKAVPINENLPADYYQCLDVIPFDTLFITKIDSSSADGNWHRFPLLNSINIYKSESTTNVLAINDMYSYVPYSSLSGTYPYVVSSYNVRNYATYNTVVDLNDIIPGRMQVIDKRSYALQSQISSIDNFYNSSTLATNKITVNSPTYPPSTYKYIAFEFKNTDIDTKYINSIETILTLPSFTMVEVNPTPCTFINGSTGSTDYVDIVNSPFSHNDIIKLKLANVGDTLPSGLSTTVQYRLFQVSVVGNVTRYYLYSGGSLSFPETWTTNGTGTAIVYKHMFNVPNFSPFIYQQLQVRSSGTLPTGLVAGTTYRAVSISGNNFQLGNVASPYYAPDFVNVTSSGTGIHQIFSTSSSLLGTSFTFQIWETSENSTSTIAFTKNVASAQILTSSLTTILSNYTNGTNIMYLGTGELNYRLKFNFSSMVTLDINKNYAMVIASTTTTLPICYPLENNAISDTKYRRVYTWENASLTAIPSPLPLNPTGYIGLSLNFRMSRIDSLYEYQLKSVNDIQISQFGSFYDIIYMPSSTILNSTTYSSLMNSFLIKNYKLELNINDDGIKDISKPLYTNSNEDSAFYTNFIAPKSEIIAKFKDFYVYGGITKPLEASLTVISQPRVEQNELTPAVSSAYGFYNTATTLSTTNGSADIAFTSHRLTVGNVIFFPTTAPTPFTVNKSYFVVKTTTNAFQIRDTTRTVKFNYSGLSGYIELYNHGLAVNDAIMFYTTPPAPFVKDRLYYVRTVVAGSPSLYFTLGETVGAASDIVATALGSAEMIGGGGIAATQTITGTVSIRYQTTSSANALAFDFDRSKFFTKQSTEFVSANYSTTSNGELFIESAILGDRLNSMEFAGNFSSMPNPDTKVVSLTGFSATPAAELLARRMFTTATRNIDHSYLSNNFYFGATLLEKPYLTLRLTSVDNIVNDFIIQTEPLYNRKGYYSLRDSSNKYDSKALTYDLSFDEMNAFRKTVSNNIVRRGLDNIYHVVGEKEGQISADGIFNATSSFFINASSTNNIFYDKTVNTLTIKNPGTFDIKKFESPGIIMIQSNIADIIIFSYQSIDISSSASNTYVFKSVTLDILSRNGISSTNNLENFIYNTETINSLTGNYFKVNGMTYFFYLKGTSVNNLVLYPYANDVLVKSDGFSSVSYEINSATDGTQNVIYEYYSPADNRGTNPTFTFLPHNKMSKKPVALFNKNKNFIFMGTDSKSVGTYIDAYAWQIINKFNIEIQKRGINAYLYKGEGIGEIKIVYPDGQSIKIMNGKYNAVQSTFPGKHVFLPELNKLEFIDLAVKTENDVDNNALALSRRKIPEICPLGANAVVGKADKSIIGYGENADDLYIFKEDGIFRITYAGDVSSNIPSVEVFQFSNNLICQAANSIKTINDEIIFLSQYGFISITNSGVTNISEKIQKDILQLIEVSPKTRINAFVNQSKQLYYCTLINEVDPTLDVKSGTYVFNTKTREWSFINQEIIDGIEDSKKRNLVAYRQKTILGTSNGQSSWTYGGKTHKLTSCDLTYPIQTNNLINNFYYISREQHTNNISQNALDQYDYISENLSANTIETTTNGFAITIDTSINSFYFHYAPKMFKMGTPPSTIKLYPNDVGNTQYGIIDSPIQHLANREIYIQIKRTTSSTYEYYSTKLVRFTYLTNYKIKYEFEYLTTNIPANFSSLESLYIVAGIPVKITFNPESGNNPDTNKLFQEYMIHTETNNKSAIMAFKTDSRSTFTNDRRFAYDPTVTNRNVFRTYIPTLAARGRYLIRQVKHDVPLENLIITGQTIVMRDTGSTRVQKDKDDV